MEIKSVGLGYGGLGNMAGAPMPVSTPQQSEVSADGLAEAQAGTSAAQTQAVHEAAKQPDSQQDKKDGEKREATDDQIKQAVSEINKRANETEAVFGIHEKTNRITIKIVDKKTHRILELDQAFNQTSLLTLLLQ